MSKTYERNYYYIHPNEISDRLHIEKFHGTQIYFDCVECDGMATYNIDDRVGYCFNCEKTIKFHSTYNSCSLSELLREIGIRNIRNVIDRMSYERDSQAVIETITTRPLGSSAVSYIKSRGITEKTMAKMPILEETTYRDSVYLAWKNLADSYELRGIFSDDKRMPRGHTKHYTRLQLSPTATMCIVGEGMFSTLSYAQLCGRLDLWYIVLNSISCKNKLIDDLAFYQSSGITKFILTLDNDQSGRDAAAALEKAMTKYGFEFVIHLPDEEGLDWNDILMKERRTTK